MRTLTTVAAVAAALAAAPIAATIATPAAAQTFSIGTNPQGSSAYATGSAVARVAKQALDMRARVVPQGGPVVTLPLVDTGRLDSSIANSMVATFAHRGDAMFKGKAQKNIRVVAALRTLRLGVIVAKDSKYKTLADLKGARISSGFAKQRNMDVFWRGILAMADMTYDDVEGVPAPNFVRGVEDFMSGTVDAAVVSLTSGKVRQAHAAKGVRYISLPDDPKAVERMKKIAAGTVLETVEPAARFPAVTGPTNIVAAPFVLMAGTETSEQTVYELTKALAGNKKLLVSAFKGMSDFKADGMHVDFGVPYHPGAMKYYRETGQVK